MGIIKAVFLDRDGTLIEDIGYLDNLKDIKILPNVVKALKLLQKNNFKLIITTNQSGIAKGYLSTSRLNRIHRELKKKLKGIKFSAILYCPHHPLDNCNCRKPKTGMIEKIKKRLKIDLSNSYSVGDKLSDVKFGKNLGGKGILISKKKVRMTDFVANDLLDAVKWIIKDSSKSL